jgi:hypothetical protein
MILTQADQQREIERQARGHGVIPSCPCVARDADVPAMVGQRWCSRWPRVWYRCSLWSKSGSRPRARGRGEGADGGRRWNFPSLLRVL